MSTCRSVHVRLVWSALESKSTRRMISSVWMWINMYTFTYAYLYILYIHTYNTSAGTQPYGWQYACVSIGTLLRALCVVLLTCPRSLLSSILSFALSTSLSMSLNDIYSPSYLSLMQGSIDIY